MASVDIRRVRKSYGATEIIKGIDCAIGDGEFLVMLGPSGCGKSTLLRMVAGLEEISDGEIAVDGTVVNHLEPKDRNIAMVFQNYALYPHMSVFDNMAYGLKIRGLPKSEIEARVRKAAGILELTPYLDRKPRALSGGQRQRVAMGRAIVREPKAFLFDEPLSNLDAKLRTQMRIEIKKLQADLGVTSLYVTHDQVEAMTLADRIMVLNGGVAEQIGSPIDVYRRPASLFVAGFIGAPAMNVLAGRVGADGRHAEILGPLGATAKGGPFDRVGLAVGAEAGRPVALGIRPEHLTLTAAGEGLAATVELVEALGADTLVHGRHASGAALVVRLPGVPQLQTGAAIHLAVPPDEVLLFDPESGRAL